MVLLLILAAVGWGAWRFRLIKVPGWEPISSPARKLLDSPVDQVASAVVTEAFKQGGVGGASVAVVPMPDGAGNAAIVVIDPATGFKPASGENGKRQQAKAVIKQLVQSNTEKKLNLQRVGLDYQEGGRDLIALTAPMSALNDFNAGKINEQQFLARVDIKVKDAQFVRDLIKLAQ
jgi:hypothetical protein